MDRNAWLLALAMGCSCGMIAATGCKSEEQAPYAPVPGSGDGDEDGGASAHDAASGSSSDGGPGNTGDSTTDPVGNGGAWSVDPKALYLRGTLQEGSCSADAIARVSSPSSYVTGFECDAELGVIVWKTSLLYVHGQRLLSFRVDTASIGRSDEPYPTMPEENDVVILDGHDICARDDGITRTLSALAGPDGDLLVSCDNTAWFDAKGKRVDVGGLAPIAIGHAGLLLGKDAMGRLAVMKLSDKVLHTVSERLLEYLIHSSPNGFHVVAQGDAKLELWSISAAGTAKKLGTYPTEHRGTMLLAGDDSLIERELDMSYDTLRRVTIDGVDEQIYTEKDKPAVKMHISSVFTGP